MLSNLGVRTGIVERLGESSEATVWTGRDVAERLAGARRRFARSWLLELAVLVVLAFAYNVVRGLPHTSRDVAVQHAYQIVSFEGAVFDLIEDRLNAWLGGLAWLAIVACYV